MKNPLLLSYDKPQVSKKVRRFNGIIEKISSYEFESLFESIPRISTNKSRVLTKYTLKDYKNNTEELVFKGFIGYELVGKEVILEERIITTLINFNPKGRENDPDYRTGLKKIKRIQKLKPLDETLPKYISKDLIINTF